jgi:hypothetical protein
LHLQAEFNFRYMYKLRSNTNESKDFYKHINIEPLADTDNFQSKGSKAPQRNILRDFFDLPLVNVFTDYLIMYVVNRSICSAEYFFGVIFELASEDQIIDAEIQGKSGNKIDLETLKNLYEQFCFLIDLKQKNMLDAVIVNILHKKGYHIICHDNQIKEY